MILRELMRGCACSRFRVAGDVAFECVLKRFRSSGDFEGGELIWSANPQMPRLT
jgi:hypothetical protein